jgi:prepilin-type N-terminal cleavage/methylation domain-containing protein
VKQGKLRENSRLGFTLVETMSVVAILALLVSLSASVAVRVQAQARSALCLRNLQSVGVGIWQYVNAFDDHIPPGEYCNLAPMQEPNVSCASWETLLVSLRYLDAPAADRPDRIQPGASPFRCPSGRDAVGTGVGLAIPKYHESRDFYVHSWYGCNGDREDVGRYPMPSYPSLHPSRRVIHTTAIVEDPSELVLVFDGSLMPVDFYENVWPVHGGQVDQTNVLFLAGHARTYPWYSLLTDWAGE